MGQELLTNNDPVKIFTMFILACVVAPIWEEIFFRGMLFPALSKVTGNKLYGALISSFMFAAIHPQGPAGWFTLMSIALMLCALSNQTKSLVPGIILHALNNGGALFLTLLLRDTPFFK